MFCLVFHPKAINLKYVGHFIFDSTNQTGIFYLFKAASHVSGIPKI